MRSSNESANVLNETNTHLNGLGDSEINNLNFLDVQSPERPYDEEGDSSNVEGNTWMTFDDYENIVEDEVINVATQIGENVTSYGSGQTNKNGEGPSNVLETSPVLRRSTRQKVLPAKFNDYVVCSNSSEPKTFHEVSQNPNWIEAMNLEMEALHKNNTYVLADLPPGRKAIGCKWIWKIKYKSSGEIDRYKARLLAKEVYMESPPGYNDNNETKVCKLIKSLYGLKQAPRQWNEKLTTALVENGFVQSKNDYSLNVETCKPAATPLQQNVVLNHEESDNDKFLSNMSEYQKIVGKLIYMSITKPDISYVVHYLSQHMHAPLQSHFIAALRVLRYLKNAPCIRVQFYKGKSLSLHAYSDAD
ncbi:ribonuclease H-like domain-containing protein [Tanacetum coccineum]